MKLSTRLTKLSQTHSFIFWLIFGNLLLSVVILIKHFFPASIPFEIMELWKRDGVYNGIKASGPIFIWCAFITAFVAFLTFNDPKRNILAEKYLAQGVAASIIAGIFEEITFRWLIFYLFIALANAFNSLTLSVFGFGAVEWFYTKGMFPLASFVSFGKLDWLVKEMPWAVAAGVIMANGKFRDGHKYLGLFGWLNSWVVGFFFFWIVFTYGLLAAIFSHFLYDLIIFVIAYVDAVLERRKGIVYQPSS